MDAQTAEIIEIKHRLRRQAKLRTIADRLKPGQTPEIEAMALYLELTQNGYELNRPPDDPAAKDRYIVKLRRELRRVQSQRSGASVAST